MKKQENWKPKFLIDQNISLKTIFFLKELGFDVKTLGELNLKGKSDYEITEAAKKEDRIIITFDKDFGEIYYFYERGNIEVIILYLKDQTSENVNKVVESFLNSINLKEIKNKLVILYEGRFRLTKY